jgi:hypothetical protein
MLIRVAAPAVVITVSLAFAISARQGAAIIGMIDGAAIGYFAGGDYRRPPTGVVYRRPSVGRRRGLWRGRVR